MNKQELNKLTMMKTWLSFMEKNQDKWQSSVPVAAGYAQVKSLVDEINLYLKSNGGTDEGETDQKLSMQEAVIENGFDLASVVCAFADEKKNLTLKSKVDYPISFLRNLRDGELSAKIFELIDLIEPYKTELEVYGIGQRRIDYVKNLAEGYEQQLPQKRHKVADKKAANSNAKAALKTAENILKERVDKIIGNFKNSEPAFYSAYQTNRKVIDYGRRYENEEETDEQKIETVK